MKSSIRNLLFIILACTFAGQALAQSVQIGSASGFPGDIVEIPITYTAGPSPDRDATAIQVILEFSETYDLVASTGAPLCNGDQAWSSQLCQWGSPGQPLLFQMTLNNATPFPTAVIARINFTIPALAVPGEDILFANSSLIGTAAGELTDPTVEVLPGSITVNTVATTTTTTTGPPGQTFYLFYAFFYAIPLLSTKKTYEYLRKSFIFKWYAARESNPEPTD